MGAGIIIVAVGAAFGLFGCGSDGSRTNRDAGPDSPDSPNSPDASDGPLPPSDGNEDRYPDGGDGGLGRVGINDAYAPLPFCSGRNIFTIKGNQGVGFCGENPAVLYKFPISEDLSGVASEEILELPLVIAGRDSFPQTIRDGGENKVLIPMRHPLENNAATFLMIDVAAGLFVGPQVSATGLQIGTNPIGDPVPIAGLSDLAFINGEFWGVLSNPTEDGTYRFGFGLALPQTEEGLVDAGVEANKEGIVERILSNRQDGFGGEVEPGTHFSFRTTHRRPTNVENLGEGLIAIQNSGTADEPASIDIADVESHQLLEGANVSLGMRELTVLPRLAADTGAFKVYPATATSLWEVDLNEGAPAEQETEISLAGSLTGQIAGVVIRGAQAIVGDSDGRVLFVNLSEAAWGTVAKTIDIGSDLTWIASDASGNIFAAVNETINKTSPHIVSINPGLLD